jgi:hypothetical protein
MPCRGRSFARRRIDDRDVKWTSEYPVAHGIRISFADPQPDFRILQIFETDIGSVLARQRTVETIDLDAILQQDARAAFAEIVSTGSDLALPDADRGAQ